jgi:hypothetical protein
MSTATLPAPAAAGRRPLRRALWCSAVATVAFAATVMLLAEILSQPTNDPAIAMSTWTPITGIASVLFGPGAFHGSFWPLAIAAGFALLAIAGLALGLLGIAWIRWCAGPAPSAMLAIALGAAYGLVLAVAVIDAIIEPTNIVMYEALTGWGWWWGFGAFGVTLGACDAWWGRRP